MFNVNNVALTFSLYQKRNGSRIMAPVVACVYSLSVLVSRPQSIQTQSARLLSSRLNWVPPPPSPARECCSLQSPPLGPRGETHSLAGEGVEVPNSDDGTGILYGSP